MSEDVGKTPTQSGSKLRRLASRRRRVIGRRVPASDVVIGAAERERHARLVDECASLIGRTIRRIVLRPFGDERAGDGGIAYDPRIELDDGRGLAFLVQETEVGEYGVLPLIVGEPRGKP